MNVYNYLELDNLCHQSMLKFMSIKKNIENTDTQKIMGSKSGDPLFHDALIPNPKVKCFNHIRVLRKLACLDIFEKQIKRESDVEKTSYRALIQDRTLYYFEMIIAHFF